jgi:hypothetical protein
MHTKGTNQVHQQPAPGGAKDSSPKVLHQVVGGCDFHGEEHTYKVHTKPPNSRKQYVMHGGGGR